MLVSICANKEYIILLTPQETVDRLISFPAQLEQQHDVTQSQVWHEINSLMTLPDGRPAKPATAAFSHSSVHPVHHQQPVDSHWKQPSQLMNLKDGVCGYYRKYLDRAVTLLYSFSSTLFTKLGGGGAVAFHLQLISNCNYIVIVLSFCK